MSVLDMVLRTKVLVRDSINAKQKNFTAVKRSIHIHPVKDDLFHFGDPRGVHFLPFTVTWN